IVLLSYAGKKLTQFTERLFPKLNRCRFEEPGRWFGAARITDTSNPKAVEKLIEKPFQIIGIKPRLPFLTGPERRRALAGQCQACPPFFPQLAVASRECATDFEHGDSVVFVREIVTQRGQ